MLVVERNVLKRVFCRFPSLVNGKGVLVRKPPKTVFSTKT